MSKRLNRNYLLHDFIRVTAMPGLLWFRPKRIYAEGADRRHIRGGAILIANHVGFFDPVYLMLAIWYRRHHFICMKEFFDNRFCKWLFTQFHCIPIDRENFSMASLRQITDELDAGHLISMYPEGRINTSEKIAPFKSGVALIAYKSKKPIIPVYIQPRKHWYSRLMIGIGETVDMTKELGAQPSLANINKVMARLEEKERSLAALVEAAQHKGGNA